MKNTAKKISSILLAIAIMPTFNMSVHAVEMKTTEKTYLVVGEKAGESLALLGIKWTNEESPIYSGPNVLETEIRKIAKDTEVKYYNEMDNGWFRIFHEGAFGYIDAQSLRDTEIVVLEEPAPAKVEVTTTKKEKTKSVIPESKKTVTFKLSFYTNFISENGGYTKTASGDDLVYGIIASNVYPLGTKIYLEGYGEMTVLDRGGKHFNSPERLDVHIPQKQGESREEYKKRVKAMGRQTITGYVMD